MTSRQIDYALSRGHWRRFLPGTFVVTSATASLEQRACAAVLWAGTSAAAAYETALALRHFSDSRSDQVEISCPRRVRSRLVRVHIVPGWGRDDIGCVTGIPVTSMNRTLVDIAARESPARMEELLDEAFRRSLTTPQQLSAYVRDRAGHGRHGAAALRALLARSSPHERVPESILETRLRQLIRSSSLPDPVPQYVVRDEGRFVARVDFAYPDRKVAIEAHGRTYHDGRWRKDLARMNALTACGWMVIYGTWDDVHIRPTETLAGIARALGVTL